jgi:Bacteriophage Sf6, terminase small subunit-like
LSDAAQPGFREDLYRARELRGDFCFGEQILDIADNGRSDWVEGKNGRLVPNKELVLRSKLRIEARQFHMSRLHPQTWGDRQQIDIKDDWSLLTDEERRRKAEELIAMIRELREPPPEPPPLVYRAEETTDETDTGDGIGWQPRSATGPDG